MSTPTPVACPVCGGTDLSPVTDYSSFEHHARFKGLGDKGVFGGPKDLNISVERARFCLDCGHAIVFTSDKGLEKLRKAFRS